MFRSRGQSACWLNPPSVDWRSLADNNRYEVLLQYSGARERSQRAFF